jgi:intracellular sulfur oxidation DsrE/DsrF family protein
VLETDVSMDVFADVDLASNGVQTVLYEINHPAYDEDEDDMHTAVVVVVVAVAVVAESDEGKTDDTRKMRRKLLKRMKWK